ncbi:MAG TPA: sigma-54 dependent transcriptional regulator [Mucilaginibacter sp.]|jgi:two-component system response regulator HydG|nr:sigma-54 dependent transcriptional regulator [Mucilaginibacter sp.]
MPSKAKILIVEDQYIEASNLELILLRTGYKVCEIARSVGAALKIIGQEKPDIVLLDIQLQGRLTGIDLAQMLSQKNIAFIFISANSRQQILDAAKMTRPYGFLLKPFREKDILIALDVALYTHMQDRELKLKNKAPVDPLLRVSSGCDIVGDSKALLLLLSNIKIVAQSEVAVLILGESGTGKELIAQNIHKLSAHSNKPFITVNCAALPGNLIESELFGHEKGAFTDASVTRIGKFEQANGGTIFLDEIGEVPLETQAKFLRVLQEKEIEIVGGKTKKVDVRILAATNRNLQEEMASGRFRADLYYRLNVFPIVSPPLRSRPGDIPLLANHFVKKYSSQEGKNITGIDDQVVELLQQYQWPGNIRELENVIHRAVILCSGNRINYIDLEAPPETSSSIFARSKNIIDVEKEHILSVLKECDWKVYGAGGAAEILGMKVPTLNSRMKKLGIKKVGLKKNNKPYKD